MCGCALNSSLAFLPARSTSVWKPRLVNGTRRSLINTKGDDGCCSRCSLRSALSSTPVNGCVAGVPCLTLRTCRVALSRSTCTHLRSTSSENSQAVSVGHEDHRGVALTPAVALSGFNQLVHLSLGQILARPVFAVRRADWPLNCALFVA